MKFCYDSVWNKKCCVHRSEYFKNSNTIQRWAAIQFKIFRQVNFGKNTTRRFRWKNKSSSQSGIENYASLSGEIKSVSIEQTTTGTEINWSFNTVVDRNPNRLFACSKMSPSFKALSSMCFYDHHHYKFSLVVWILLLSSSNLFVARWNFRLGHFWWFYYLCMMELENDQRCMNFLENNECPDWSCDWDIITERALSNYL